MSQEIEPAADDAKAKRKAQGERYNRIMWAYVCGAITLLSYLVGLEPTFIPLGFGFFGVLLSWQLLKIGDQKHSVYAGILSLGGVSIWLTFNWPMFKHWIGR
jgi:hypothetical protein